jgi:hypothetical protein
MASKMGENTRWDKCKRVKNKAKQVAQGVNFGVSLEWKKIIFEGGALIKSAKKIVADTHIITLGSFEP